MSMPDSFRITDFRPYADGRKTVVVPYRLEGKAGYMLRWTGEDDRIVSVPSPVSGWHAVHLGFMGSASLRIKLSSESFFRTVESTNQWHRQPCEGEEAFWKVADLTGVSFELRPRECNSEMRWEPRDCQLAYLRLAPIARRVARQRSRRLRNGTTRTAGAVLDAHILGYSHCPRTATEVEGLIEPFIESDFKRICMGVSITSFRLIWFSKAGYYLGQNQVPDRMDQFHNRRTAMAMEAARRGGFDPVEVMIAFAAREGMELWPSYRIQQDYPLDTRCAYDFNSPISEQHPEWRHRDKNGEVCSYKFSHFHPGWEQYKLDLLAELAEKGPAGIHLNLACGCANLFDWEPNAVARFREEYGIDPTATAEPPPQWYRFICDHFTKFMRRLRAQTDRIGAVLGRRIQIAVQVSADHACVDGGNVMVSSNYAFGFDLKQWAAEGLVDSICPSYRGQYAPIFLEPLFADLGQARARVKIIPSIGQNHRALYPPGYDWRKYFLKQEQTSQPLLPIADLDAWRILRDANDLYQQGADAVDVWEMGGAYWCLNRWHVLKRIGNRAWLAKEFGTRIGPMITPVVNHLAYQLAPLCKSSDEFALF